MNVIQKTFGLPKVLLPVIHVRDEKQVLANVELARAAHADGVFLIDHTASGNPEKLHKMYLTVRSRYPTYWVGLNFLGTPPHDALQLIDKTVSGLWVNNAGIEDAYHPTYDQARSIWSHIELRRCQGLIKCLYFGGFAFKGQNEVRDLALLSGKASEFMDVVTTSGEATGSAPDLNKIRVIHAYMKKETTTLAIASGVTPKNVEPYLPHCDCFMVASGISEDGDFFNLNFMKTTLLAAIIHTYR